jgi:hypothetical protein
MLNQNQRIDNLAVACTPSKVGLIYNPLGGWFRKHAIQAKELLAALPEIKQIQEFNATEFEQAVITVVSMKIEWLIIVGGDGTLQGIISCLFERLPPHSWPKITIVPAGTTNMTALDLGAGKRAEQVLLKIRQYLFQSSGVIRHVKRPVLRIEQTGKKNVYGMVLGFGLIARGVKFSRGQIKQIGITGNIFTILIVLHSLVTTFLGKPKAAWAPAYISQKDSRGVLYKKVYLFALVSALEKLLLGIRPYWGQESAPLHVTLIEQNSKHFWWNIWSLITGRGHHLQRSDGYISYNTTSIELWLDDEYIVDGELHHVSSQHGPMKITADGPIQFRVL